MSILILAGSTSIGGDMGLRHLALTSRAASATRLRRATSEACEVPPAAHLRHRLHGGGCVAQGGDYGC